MIEYTAEIKVVVFFKREKPLTDAEIKTLDICTSELSYLKDGTEDDMVYLEKNDIEKEGYDEDYTQLIDIQKKEVE